MEAGDLPCRRLKREAERSNNGQEEKQVLQKNYSETTNLLY